MANDANGALNAQVYSLVMIGSQSADGEPNGMTANWVTQVSFEPCVVAVAIQEGAHTRRNIEATGVFAVSLYQPASHDLALKFTQRSTSGERRLEGEPVSYHQTGAPVLNAAAAWYECHVIGRATPGDHVVFFGEVIGGDTNPGVAATTIAETGMSYAD
ncbi:MAG: flavin reductase family protein [Dehalococcoidia bacterium]|nr:flavin reductase family protein [Dehalococcoidia bacterium]